MFSQYKRVLIDPSLRDRLINELKELKNDLLAESQELKSFIKNNLDQYDRDYFNNEIKSSPVGELVINVKDLTRDEIKSLVKLIKEALNQIGFKAVIFSLKRGRLKVIVEF